MRGPGTALRAAFVAASALLFLTSLPQAAYAERTIALSSGSFSFDVDPGQSGEGEVIVMNDGDEPLKALVYMTDLEIDETGVHTFVEPRRDGASILTTPASWFRVFMPADSKAVGNTPYLELDVGERVPIRFAFSPPANTPSGDHNVVLFFEMFELSEGSEGAAALVSGRLGTRIALRVTGEVIENLTIRPFEVPAFRIGSAIPFNFTVNNSGNTNKRVAVTAELLDRSEQSVVASVVASDTPVYANARYRFDGALNTGVDRLGPHTVEVRVQYFLEGSANPTELVEQRSVWLVPLWAILVLAFIVLDVIGYAIIRARKRGRSRAGAATEAAPTIERPPGFEPTARAEAVRVDAQREEPAVAPSPKPYSAAVAEPPASVPRSARHQKRMSRKDLRREAEERRRRRAERATETWRPPGTSEGTTPPADGQPDDPV
jgi:hypothetical protein